MLKDLIVFQKAYELLKWLHTLAAKFPKSEKFVLAQRLENAALDLVDAVIEANDSLDKGAALGRANVALEKTRIWLRLAFELRFAGMSQYEFGSRSLDELGRLLGGLRKRFAPPAERAGRKGQA
ncbi:MAG: diversity-generating retroelement protein Avd [Elusimicrobia bacterium]|nr:diversity-generating retroelement protein Avd [Elusimicrobiota bacterium]